MPISRHFALNRSQLSSHFLIPLNDRKWAHCREGVLWSGNGRFSPFCDIASVVNPIAELGILTLGN